MEFGIQVKHVQLSFKVRDLKKTMNYFQLIARFLSSDCAAYNMKIS